MAAPRRRALRAENAHLRPQQARLPPPAPPWFVQGGFSPRAFTLASERKLSSPATTTGRSVGRTTDATAGGSVEARALIEYVSSHSAQVREPPGWRVHVPPTPRRGTSARRDGRLAREADGRWRNRAAPRRASGRDRGLPTSELAY